MRLCKIDITFSIFLSIAGDEFVKPLANNLTNYSTFESQLYAGLAEGHVIGFLLDNRKGDLKRSGLLLHRDAVRPLDELLGQRATLFYPDPRKWEGRAYAEVVHNFAKSLLGSGFFNYHVNTPALILMTYRAGQFENADVMSLDTAPMCMWQAEVANFFEGYLTSHPQERRRKDWWLDRIKSHAGTITLEAVSVSVSVLFSKFLPS